MKKHLLIAAILLFHVQKTAAQDTFSIVAVDSLTGEVGSAGASCVDLILIFPNYATDFLGDLIPGQGAINTQASYNATNQSNARQRLLAGDTPQQIISWLVANDAQGNSGSNRQYGIAALVNGSPQTAGFTGANTLNYKNHIAGPNYCIQGNILLGQSVLDSMEARFLNTPGNLACKLMAALQGAKVVGADTRCASNGTSSLFAFVKVAQPGDSIGNPSLLLSVKTPGGSGIEPIDSLQVLFDAQQLCVPSGLSDVQTVECDVFPNPVVNILTIRWNDPAASASSLRYRIVDLKGTELISGTCEGKSCQVTTSTLSAGVYQLELFAEDRLVVKKFIKR